MYEIPGSSNLPSVLAPPSSPMALSCPFSHFALGTPKPRLCRMRTAFSLPVNMCSRIATHWQKSFVYRFDPPTAAARAATSSWPICWLRTIEFARSEVAQLARTEPV